MHCILGGGEPQQGEPTSCPVSDRRTAPAQIWRFEFLGRFSLYWLPRAFSFCFPGRELPTGPAAESLQLWMLQPHGLRDQGQLEATPPPRPPESHR